MAEEDLQEGESPVGGVVLLLSGIYRDVVVRPSVVSGLGLGVLFSVRGVGPVDLDGLRLALDPDGVELSEEERSAASINDSRVAQDCDERERSDERRRRCLLC